MEAENLNKPQSPTIAKPMLCTVILIKWEKYS
jgi:hypothetical protein